ncbi:MAG: efflux RND transporter periplasmic adaptor subunit [Tannerellaceae bacterium]|jgi:Cu(I)/Ag(I) efflux system membrane fusion protein|nr:efflux RND transporter periplasmic adaptor subunit [Tannerellaceae bacterium]
MKPNNPLKRYGYLAAACALGILAGMLVQRSCGGNNQPHIHTDAEAVEQTWTCSMHPQIRQDQPGKCPLCAMDLIPLKSTGSSPIDDPDAIAWSTEAAALADIRSSRVERAPAMGEVRLYGTIRIDERRLQSQTSHVSGRIEKLAVRFVGETIQAEQAIAEIYSPDLLNAQQELLEALHWADNNPNLLKAAREKLRQWKIPDHKIAEIERSAKASPTLEIISGYGGVVINKRVEEGDYVERGGVLFELADLSSVWAVFEAYESDLPYLEIGGKLEYTLPALPGESFSGRISFIDPTLDPVSRTLKVRVETSNPKLRLKPGMYAHGIVKGRPGGSSDALSIPRSAVLWTGKRSVVYVKISGADAPAFKLRDVELGAYVGSEVIVLSGLQEGEEVVTNGAFMIDASAQLEGKPSMMNRAEGELAMLSVGGLCEMCKDRIESIARSQRGVSSAVWDMQSRKLELRISGQGSEMDAIAKALAHAGHDNDLYRADDAVYSALPECCHYRLN